VRPVAPTIVGLLVLLASLWLRLDGLDLYATADEGYWMQRSLRFGAALARGDLASTFRAGHPGVTVMWTGVLGIGPARLVPFLPERYIGLDNLERAPGYLAAFSAARQAIALIVAVLVATIVLLFWRLVGPGPALAGGALLVLDPYVVGMTRLLHVDALLAPLMTVSVLAGLVYWRRSARWPYLAMSAVAGGLALLTKAPAGCVPLFLGLVCLAGLLRGRPRAAPRTLLPLLLWGAGAAFAYILLFPALWVDPVPVIQSLVDFIFLVGLQPHDGNFFLGRPILDDPGPLYYVIAIPLRLSPLAALGIALLTLPSREEARPVARWLLVYALSFIVLMTLASKKFDRYMLPVLMVLDLVAGVGFWRAAVLLSNRRKNAGGAMSCAHTGVAGNTASGKVGAQFIAPFSPAPLPLLLATLVAAIQAALLVSVWPYPVAYYNPLAGGATRARQLVMVGWGEGLEQAAAFLNRLPNADRLVVATSYNHVVRPRFVGTTVALPLYVRPVPGHTPPRPDYVVVYVNGRQRRQISPEVEQAEALGAPIFVARVNGQEYAWVYRVPRTGPAITAPAPSTAPVPDDSESEEN
jgi:4-amino-4-deoxy-L-arabinose transferase-like glycosyltransferase